ncbi:SHOCT domain-containing protein [Weissella confusa]|uniref:SHOCT domain-containing protein n=1 Tax=Weissella confusa TaxID=1583 RepID=UPI0022E99039|nr:SHOCT domain-containing protein [Weissella confusa]
MGLFSKKTEAEKQELVAQRAEATQKRKEDKAYIKDFTKIATTRVSDYLLWSESTDEVVINRGVMNMGTTQMFKRADIRSFEVIKDGEKSERFGLGGAAVGGLILGPIGLLGGFLLKKKKNEIRDLRVRIYTTGEQAMHDITLISEKTKADGWIAKVANTSLDQIVEFLQKAIIELEESKSIQETAPAPQDNGSSVADELAKLKSLLDAGILTQDEFDAQKAKVLG